MKDVQKIELIFENTEWISINSEDIVDIEIKDIKCDIKRVCANAISKMLYSDYISIEISKKADTKYISFGEESSDTKFERIQQCNDITQIVVYYDDETYEIIFVDYDEDEKEENKNQYTSVLQNGNLSINID